LLHDLREEVISHGGSLHAKGSPKGVIKAISASKLVAQVSCDRCSTKLAVLAHLRDSNVILVGGLTLDQLPKAVLFSNRVNNLASSDLFHKTVEKFWQSNKAIACTKDLLAQREECALREFLSGLNFFELATSFVRRVTLIELQEGHYFAKIEAGIEVMVECRPEVVDREVRQVHSVTLTVVRKMGDSINIVCLEAFNEEFLEVAGVHR